MKNIKIIETDTSRGLFWAEQIAGEVTAAKEMKQLVIYPDEKETTIRGFGGAFTEAAAHTYMGLPEDKKDNLIEDLYGDSGLRYTMGRIHMNSCDFALGNYTYIEEGDETLDTFDISHDKKEIIPMIEAATQKLGRQPVLMMAPWSPPPFMKTNGEMNHGGKLRDEYKELWAKYYVRFIEEYRSIGIDISFTSIQNEPMATQTWDSCIYTAQDEAEFVTDYLGPAMEKAGLLDKMKIFVWDHNKEISYVRLKEILERKDAEKYVSGCAVHWYTGDHFENLHLIRKHFPEKEIFFTEGCVEYSRLSDASDVQNAEMYAHQMIGNLKGGITAIFDWNLIVDFQGGPNHVGNYCDAPIKALESGKDYEKKLSYYYIGHLTRYIKEGANLIWSSNYTDKLDAAAFLNADGQRVVVILNKSGEELPVELREGDESTRLTLAPHSIQTVLYE